MTGERVYASYLGAGPNSRTARRGESRLAEPGALMYVRGARTLEEARVIIKTGERVVAGPRQRFSRHGS